MKFVKESPKVVWISAAIVGGLLCSMLFVSYKHEERDLPKQQLPADFESYSSFEKGHYYFSPGQARQPDDLSRALVQYRAALDDDNMTDAQRQIAWYQIGRIHFLEGRFEAAINAFDVIVTRYNAGVPSVYYMLGLTYAYRAKDEGSADDWAAAEQAFSTFLEYDPSSPWGRTDLAWVYFAQGKFEAMLPILEEGLKYEPESPWLNNMYGLALLNSGNTESAHAAFVRAAEHAQKLTPDDWGQAYPGNDPALYAEGLASFQGAIQSNIDLAISRE